jgi:dihydroflavonol-4-reductase
MSICVTGGCGFIGSHIVKLLVDKGYTVNITLQNKKKREKELKFWSNYNVNVFEAELTTEGAFKEAFKGVSCVIHCAGPFKVSSTNPKQDIIDPIVMGTKNVVNECLASESVSKLIYLSSAAVIRNDEKKKFTEDDWNETLTEKNPYGYAKYLAEQIVVQAKQMEKLNICILNPSRCIGSFVLKRNDSLSMKTINDLISGSMKKGCNNRQVAFVNVLDVANIAILCFESKDIRNERFIVSLPSSHHLLEISAIIAERFPDLPLPTKMIGKEEDRFEFDNSKVEKMLNFKFTDLKETIWQAVTAIRHMK